MSGIARLAGLAGLAVLIACAGSVDVPIWEQPPPPAADSPVVKPDSLHRFELDNGLRVLTLEFLPWHGARKHWIGWGAGLAVAAGAVFLIGVA